MVGEQAGVQEGEIALGDHVNDTYEEPTVTELGTIEEWTKQIIDLSIIIG
jgi:hypothetical protein